jgi:cyclohexanecarboxylate-CoA ligase
MAWACGELPHLKHLTSSTETATRARAHASAAEPAGKPAGLRPDDMSVLMFTSGTTGEPKGVDYTSNSLVDAQRPLRNASASMQATLTLVASPVGHVWVCSHLAVGLPRRNNGSAGRLGTEARGIVDGARRRDVYRRLTPFLSDICACVKAGAPRPASLRSFLCGGAPIPISAGRAGSKRPVLRYARCGG